MCRIGRVWASPSKIGCAFVVQIALENARRAYRRVNTAFLRNLS